MKNKYFIDRIIKFYKLILLCLLFFIICMIFSFVTNNSVIQGLLSNIASSFLFLIFTILVVDYILEKRTEQEWNKVKNHVYNSILDNMTELIRILDVVFRTSVVIEFKDRKQFKEDSIKSTRKIYKEKIKPNILSNIKDAPDYDLKLIKNYIIELKVDVERIIYMFSARIDPVLYDFLIKYYNKLIHINRSLDIALYELKSDKPKNEKLNMNMGVANDVFDIMTLFEKIFIELKNRNVNVEDVYYFE